MSGGAGGAGAERRGLKLAARLHDQRWCRYCFSACVYEIMKLLVFMKLLVIPACMTVVLF